MKGLMSGGGHRLWFPSVSPSLTLPSPSPSLSLSLSLSVPVPSIKGWANTHLAGIAPNLTGSALRDGPLNNANIGAY